MVIRTALREGVNCAWTSRPSLSTSKAVSTRPTEWRSAASSHRRQGSSVFDVQGAIVLFLRMPPRSKPSASRVAYPSRRCSAAASATSASCDNSGDVGEYETLRDAYARGGGSELWNQAFRVPTRWHPDWDSDDGPNGHRGAGYADKDTKGEWRTPWWFFYPIHAAIGFTWSIWQRPRTRHFWRVGSRNSLPQPWVGEIGWLNAPFTRGLLPQFSSILSACMAARGSSSSHCCQRR